MDKSTTYPHTNSLNNHNSKPFKFNILKSQFVSHLSEPLQHLNTVSEKEVKQVVHSICETYSKIDGLVNNAGVGGVPKSSDELSEQEFDLIMSVNVKGVFLCTKHVVPYMKKDGGGSIVNISSLAGLVGMKKGPAYSASKGAVRLLTKADAKDYAKYKIRVNSVHPGFVWTPMVEEHIEVMAGSRERLDAIFPMGSMGEAIDIANGILFLISQESKFMTGSELVMDGGLG